ncbi:carboxymuconolactone decarboxylase family protein [Gilvimarinus japonicus]|uniref:Carboxymuconolactone decarboxylase family protein n=1 Tax=Gilvimarinus japonicus TaxID=1796469 RepID=A0ABV7HL10_9GAMM
MHERISQQAVYQYCPRLAEHLLALGKTDTNAQITSGIIHLVKLRVSQINGCGFCQHMHSAEARKDGERQERLDVLPAWRELACFTPPERAALAWAEATTLISQQAVNDATYQNAVTHFGEAGLIELTTVILEINSWNRISVSLQFQPAIAD